MRPGANLHWSREVRHVMATTATRAGVSLADLARILGHGSLAMVSRYAGHTPDNFADLAREKMEAALQAPPRVQEA